jgi:hypothetical protein
VYLDVRRVVEIHVLPRQGGIRCHSLKEGSSESTFMRVESTNVDFGAPDDTERHETPA